MRRQHFIRRTQRTMKLWSNGSIQHKPYVRQILSIQELQVCIYVFQQQNFKFSKITKHAISDLKNNTAVIKTDVILWWNHCRTPSRTTVWNHSWMTSGQSSADEDQRETSSSLWSDESKFEILFWKPSRSLSALRSKSCISGWYESVLVLNIWHIWNANIKAETFIWVLEQRALPSGQHLYRRESCIFQQDNSIVQMRVQMLNWSPEVSPTENIWSIRRRRDAAQQQTWHQTQNDLIMPLRWYTSSDWTLDYFSFCEKYGFMGFINHSIYLTHANYYFLIGVLIFRLKPVDYFTLTLIKISSSAGR